MSGNGNLIRVGHNRVTALPFLRQTQLAGLTTLKFLCGPTTSLLYPPQSDIVRDIDKNHRITPLLPTRFQQYCGIQQNSLIPGLPCTDNLINDASLNLRMDDLLQIVPRGTMPVAVAEHSPREHSPLYFALWTENVITKVSSQSLLDVSFHQYIVTKLISIDHTNIGL